MGDLNPAMASSVNQSPLVAALSTPSAAQAHNEGQPFNTPPNGTPGPLRVGQPINMRPAPYPPRVGHPPGQFGTPHGPPQQVVLQRPMPPAGHPQMIPQPLPINHVPPPAMPGPQVLHLPQTGGGILDKTRLDDLVKQIDPNTNLDDNVKEALIEYCDEFISDLLNKVCNLASYRVVQQQFPNKKIEVRDVEMVLNMAYGMPAVPRSNVHVFGQPATQYPKIDGNPPTDAHKQRMMLIKKQLKKI